MKRLCIYVVFDRLGIVNSYIGNILCEIKKFVNDIIVVCNFDRIEKGYEYIKTYTNTIIYRNNEGYDAGAYRDVIIDYVGWDKLYEYDELIFSNDTYFGPIYPFDDMFELMDVSNCDYWGITRRNAGYSTELSLQHYPSHIQSYFLCFKKTVLNSTIFCDFWNDFNSSDNKNDTIVEYEIGLNILLDKNGFVGKAYSDVKNGGFTYFEDTNPYNKFSFELVRDYKIPIIKRSSLFSTNPWLTNTLLLLEYINKHNLYDTSVIKDYINTYQKKGDYGTFIDFDLMGCFVREHDRIYIYGAGVWGQMIIDYFNYKKWEFESVVVTKSKGGNNPEFSSITLNKNDGIIIAQKKKSVCDEILEYIGDTCSRENIFTPNYIE